MQKKNDPLENWCFKIMKSSRATSTELKEKNCCNINVLLRHLLSNLLPWDFLILRKGQRGGKCRCSVNNQVKIIKIAFVFHVIIYTVNGI